MSLQFNSTLHFIQISTRSNSLISALNTNTIIRLTSYPYTHIEISPTIYFDKKVTGQDYDILDCYTVSSITPAGFYPVSYAQTVSYHKLWPGYYGYISIDTWNASVVTDGFFGGCTSLDVLLASTFDCLHNTNCLTQLADYFPNLTQVCITFSCPLHQEADFLLFRLTSTGQVLFHFLCDKICR